MTYVKSLSPIDKIKAEAFNLGFLLCGVSNPDVPISDYGIYNSWINNGYHHSLKYLSSERALSIRKDPKSLLSNCRSIISLGIPYPHPTPHDSSKSGKISSYAWNLDYHDVIIRLVDQFMDRISPYIGNDINWKAYTDTGPILERSFAQKAGLGWIGKNSMLISPKFGSHFFLAEILLDKKIEALNKPGNIDYCGICHNCIDACPTQCILPDRTIDTKKCISYLTIENKEEIPIYLRKMIGNWVFGCDICQNVCPWNKKDSTKTHVIDDFKFRKEIAFPDLLEDIHLTQDQFSKKFKNSPIKRAKRRGYLRNVAVAIGNSSNNEALPHLIEVMAKEKDSLIKRHVAWALGQIGGKDIYSYLREILNQENDPYIISEIKSVLNT